jgi:hypothetical protein
MMSKRKQEQEQRGTTELSNHEGWHFLYWDDLGDSQNEVDNQKKDTFAEDEQDT